MSEEATFKRPAPLIAKEAEERELPPEETTLGICVWIIDLGTQYNMKYGNESRKVLIAWELPDCLMESGEPFMISRQYTLSLHEKALLRHDLESWVGTLTKDDLAKGVDLKKLLNRTCYVKIKHNESKSNNRVYANVAGVVALPKGLKPVHKPFNNPIYFDMSKSNLGEINALPNWVQGIIKQSKEWRELTEEPEDFFEDVPPLDEE